MDRRAYYSDVDDTLLMHDLSEFPGERQVTVTCNGREFVGVPNQFNINLLIKFYKLGYEIHVWSRTGKSWATAVVEALGIGEFVDHCLTKPDYHADDKPAEYWMGPRIYRDAKTGEEV